MPEGDTIHRVANRLRPALVGRPLVRFEAARAVGPRPAVGEAVIAVEAVGKHLVIRFAGGVTLRTHLRMTGSWHLYRPGTAWRRPAHQARAVVVVPEWEAVCFRAPVVALAREAPGRDDPALARLGPDLCRPDADLDEVVARLAAYADADTEIGPALLDQRVAAGIGNVFKSEVLWACRVSPLARVADLDDDLRRALVTTAARQLRANVDRPGPRTTLPGGGLAVYGREGRPCPRCATPVRRRRQGAQARSTYWCPVCQPHPGQ